MKIKGHNSNFCAGLVRDDRGLFLQMAAHKGFGKSGFSLRRQIHSKTLVIPIGA
jgi:hypothetical protein